MYGNEADTGAALAAGGVARDDLCITTKVHPDQFGEAAFLPSVEASLTALRTDYVDILLLHWPTPGGDIGPSLKLLQQALDRGLARNIGVSNYTAAMMRQAGVPGDAGLSDLALGAQLAAFDAQHLTGVAKAQRPRRGVTQALEVHRHQRLLDLAEPPQKAGERLAQRRGGYRACSLHAVDSL